MGLGVRFFIVQPNDTFERWSEVRFNRVFDGDESVAQFAGRRLRYAIAFVQFEDRKPVGVRRVEWGVLTIEPNGKHDSHKALLTSMNAANVLGFRSPDGVLDGRGRFYKRSSRWTPSAPLKAAIVAAALR
jgi:hypothetical protein